MNWKDQIEIPTNSSGYFKELENKLKINTMKFELRFKTDKGLYKNFSKEFKDERHRDNFIDKVERDYGWKLIGIEKI